MNELKIREERELRTDNTRAGHREEKTEGAEASGCVRVRIE